MLRLHQYYDDEHSFLSCCSFFFEALGPMGLDGGGGVRLGFTRLDSLLLLLLLFIQREAEEEEEGERMDGARAHHPTVLLALLLGGG